MPCPLLLEEVPPSLGALGARRLMKGDLAPAVFETISSSSMGSSLVRSDQLPRRAALFLHFVEAPMLYPDGLDLHTGVAASPQWS